MLFNKQPLSSSHFSIPHNLEVPLYTDWLDSRKEISQGAKNLYRKLKHCGKKTGRIYPKRQTLAKWQGVHERTIDRWLKELASCNLVVITRRGKNQSNSYELPLHIWMKEAKKSVSDTEEVSIPEAIECTQILTREGATMLTPYIDEEIIEKNNNISTIDQSNERKENKMYRVDPLLEKEFEELYKGYPRKDNKWDAFNQYRYVREELDFETIKRKLRGYERKKKAEAEPNAKVIFHKLSNWFNHRLYLDDYGQYEEEPKKPAGPIISQSPPTNSASPEEPETPEQRKKGIQYFEEARKILKEAKPIEVDPSFKKITPIQTAMRTLSSGRNSVPRYNSGIPQTAKRLGNLIESMPLASVTQDNLRKTQNSC